MARLLRLPLEFTALAGTRTACLLLRLRLLLVGVITEILAIRMIVVTGVILVSQFIVKAGQVDGLAIDLAGRDLEQTTFEAVPRLGTLVATAIVGLDHIGVGLCIAHPEADDHLGILVRDGLVDDVERVQGLRAHNPQINFPISHLVGGADESVDLAAGVRIAVVRLNFADPIEIAMPEVIRSKKVTSSLAREEEALEVRFAMMDLQ